MAHATDIWRHYIIKDMELLQINFLEQVLDVNKKTSTDIVLGELGVFPVEVNIKYRMICFWVRFLMGNDTKLSHVMYKCLLHLDMTGSYSSPWITCIKYICNECGMSWVWESQNVTSLTWFKKAILLRLKDQ